MLQLAQITIFENLCCNCSGSVRHNQLFSHFIAMLLVCHILFKVNFPVQMPILLQMVGAHVLCSLMCVYFALI